MKRELDEDTLAWRAALGVTVRRFRQRVDKRTQDDVSAAANLGWGTVGRVERGQVSVSSDLLPRLARGLDCTVAELMGAVEEEFRKGRR